MQIKVFNTLSQKVIFYAPYNKSERHFRYFKYFKGKNFKMPCENSYVIWNNKGGVGKTTIAFNLSTMYAIRNPNVDVLVIDMCPQANVSSTLLKGRSNLFEVQSQTISIANLNYPKTVAGYLQSYVDNCSGLDMDSFYVKINNFNKSIPENMYLFCGDENLYLVAHSISHSKNAPRTINNQDPWGKMVRALKSFIEGRNRIGNNESFVCFIDTNPAFAEYTEIAIAGGNRLIIPLRPDDYSYNALKDLFNLLYGINTNQRFKLLEGYQFSYRAKQSNIEIPKIHLIIQNGTHRYNLRPSTKASSAIMNNTSNRCYDIFRENEIYFSDSVANEEEFENRFIKSIGDLNQISYGINYLGCPIPNLGSKPTIQLDGGDTFILEIKREQKELIQEEIENVIEML
jgi:cellulose biosynthesis protein BcsQ